MSALAVRPHYHKNKGALTSRATAVVFKKKYDIGSKMVQSCNMVIRWQESTRAVFCFIVSESQFREYDCVFLLGALLHYGGYSGRRCDGDSEAENRLL